MMPPRVIDCYSIHSAVSQHLSLTCQLFLFPAFLTKMPFCSRHQQHVFAFKRVAAYAALGCLANCSPVPSEPGLTHILTSIPTSWAFEGLGPETLRSRV